MRIALIIGHTPDAPGGCSQDGSICEYTYNEELVQRVAQRVHEGDVEVVTRGRPNDYRGLPDRVNATKADAAVSLHCNAFDGSVSGSEVLHWHSSVRGRRLAKRLLDRFIRTLRLPNRGTRACSFDDRGGYLLGETAMPCVIAEPFFIDNPSDLSVGMRRKEALASAYADGIDRYISDLRRSSDAPKHQAKGGRG